MPSNGNSDMREPKPSPAPSVAEIVGKYLETHGFDGLINEWTECGCIATDLMPCGGDYDCTGCVPGWRIDYPEDDCPCGEGCAWHIQAGTLSE